MGDESPQGNLANSGDDQQWPKLPPGYVLPSLAHPESYRVLTPLPVTAPDPGTAERRAISSLVLSIAGLVGAITMLSYELSVRVFCANCLLALSASIIGMTFGRGGLHSRRRHRVAIAGITVSGIALTVAGLALVYLTIAMAVEALNS